MKRNLQAISKHAGVDLEEIKTNAPAMLQSEAGMLPLQILVRYCNFGRPQVGWGNHAGKQQFNTVLVFQLIGLMQLFDSTSLPLPFTIVLAKSDQPNPFLKGILGLHSFNLSSKSLGQTCCVG